MFKKKANLRILAASLVAMMLFSVVPVFGAEDSGLQHEAEVETITSPNFVEEESATEPEAVEIEEEADEVIEVVDDVVESPALDAPEADSSLVEEAVLPEEEASEELLEGVTLEAFAAGDAVTTVEELKNAVAAATADTTITLADNFAFANATIVMPGVNVTIDGGDKVWSGGVIKINGAGAGSLTIQNLKMDGTAIAGRLFDNTASNGTLTLQNVEIYNATGGAIDLSTTGTAKTVLNKVHLHDNHAGRGPAILLGENANVSISYSTIENNSGASAGYECGAIASKNFRAALEINNTVFRNNANKALNSGVFGGGGGAMSIHYLFGTLSISECVFDGNQTNGADGSIAKTYDGGAIYIIDARDGATVSIDKTTFSNNLAYDDGGAIMLQGTGNPGVTTNITNCTFYGNKAYGLDGAGYSGGAIQFFKNGGSSKMTNNLVSCTFVANQGGNENSPIEQRGGAIGLSGAGIFATAAATRNDCLFIGNTVYGADGQVNSASGYKDISNNGTTQSGTLNVVNVDKGATPITTTKEILGRTTPILTDNFSSVKAGINGETVKTIAIAPESIADNTYTGTVAVSATDQRNLPRVKDQGAIEIAFVKYNANGGVFDIEPMGDDEYDGTKYYPINEEGTVTDYYTIGYAGGVDTVENGLNTLKAINGTLVFSGWSTDKDATDADPAYAADAPLTQSSEGVTLYAVWKEREKFTLNYVANLSGATGAAPTDVVGYTGTALTIANQGTLVKDHFTFLGWNTAANGTGTNYAVGDALTLTANITLYGQWKEDDKFTVTYDANDTSIPGVLTGLLPVDSNSYYVGDTATVLGNIALKANTNGTLTKPGHTVTGWNTKADGTGTAYAAGATFAMPAANVTLYAQWTEKAKFTLTYDGNGSTAGTAPVDANSSYYDGATVSVLGVGNLAREGFTFVGWNTKADGTGTAYSEATTFAIAANTVLYAQWSANPAHFTVTYDGNGNTAGTAAVDANSPYLDGSTVVVLGQTDLVKTGFEFIGWNTKADGTGTACKTNDTFTIKGNIVLYAQWKAIEVPAPAPQPEITSPQTGDTTPILPIIIVLVISAALVATLVVVYLRKKKNDTHS